MFVIDILLSMVGVFKSRSIFFTLAAVFLFSACASTVIIADDLSPAELIQRAQEASDKNRYKIAMQYYEALHQRYQHNLDLVITAEYEIAFIHYKLKDYYEARQGFNALLEYYNSPDEELLPQHFKVLTNIVLERMDEKENQRSLFSKRR